MQISTSTTIIAHFFRWARRGSCRHAHRTSRYAEAALDSSLPLDEPQPTFESAGIRAPIVSALRTAFPDVKYPTPAQNEFIPAILSGKDVLLKDATGTGKSFGVIIALLNKARRRAIPTRTGVVSVQPCITSLVIVPHRDLAYQFHHWIDRLVNLSVSPGNTPPSLASIAQVIVRGGDVPIAEQQAAILAEPPHVLIGTPQALLELLKDGPISPTQLEMISTVYVDEVDYMVESVPKSSTRRTQDKIRRRMAKHPGAADQVLDLIFKSGRKAKWEDKGDRRTSYVNAPDGPQLIMSSATLRHHLSNRLCGGTGWIDRGALVKVSGDGLPISPMSVRSQVTHSVLLVSKNGQVRNIDGAQEAIQTPVEGEGPVTVDEIFNSGDAEIDISAEEMHQTHRITKSKINHNALEAVAAAFALDVPSVALLSLPASAPVQRIVQELRALCVNAHSLDLLMADQGRTHLLQGKTQASDENPVMLVSTLATTRGLDLPELTHVFLLGVPEGRRADAYLHVAGRVGRFGRPGKVITVLEEREEERREDGTISWVRDDPKRMMMLLEEIGVEPTQFDRFD